MIAFAKPVRPTKSPQDQHNRFLAMLPQIRRKAELVFRVARPEAREELVAEVIANAYCAYLRLVDRGKEDLAYPTPLALFAISQVRCGRRVGSRSNLRDVSSPYARAKRNIKIVRLDRFNQQRNEWQEVLVEDPKAGPADTAAARIDMADWFNSLGLRMQRIALMLGRGESTSSVAQVFQISAGRVSQLRRELQQSWDAFQSESSAACA
jgi:hypothetical protein